MWAGKIPAVVLGLGFSFSSFSEPGLVGTNICLLINYSTSSLPQSQVFRTFLICGLVQHSTE